VRRSLVEEVFRMILDVPQAEVGLAEKLQGLLDALPLSHPKRKLVEADLYRVRGGEKGERGVAYHLRFWYGEADDMVVANGLRLVFGGRVAQIDHLVGVPGELLVLESKALPDRVRITRAGDWVRLKWANGRPVEEGIYNPAEQNERHMAVLADVLRDLGADPLPPLVSVVVLPRPEVVVEGYRPELGYRLVRVDGLRAFIEERRRLPAAACGPAGDLVGRLLRYHVPAALDGYARDGIDPKEVLPLKERVRFDPGLRGYRCAFCGSEMALLKNRMGLA